ncbi:hypothetical protein [Ectopseudomonas mendocina]|uniref:Uncharacterized protein n=1 Tax=Ectopseudomonas mendocina TaxID=300 RepID=A0A2R3QK77_ECTME|nr:hypothetical protein [Pseudomonas mendocina]AVO52140.1 hypothetical protein C7A17_04935 [Pseudomonas mendocina]
MRTTLIRLLQGLCLLPGTALFIGLLTCQLQQACQVLAWPLLTEPDGHLAIELVLACLPAFALFLLAACGLLRRAQPVTVLLVFALCAAFAAYCAVNLLASAYGNTWTPGEIFHELFLSNLDLLVLALSPGLGLLVLLEWLNHPRL